MVKYCFFSRIDPNKEPIGVVMAESKEEAIEILSQEKRLEKALFLQLYEVTEKHNHNGHTRQNNNTST